MSPIRDDLSRKSLLKFGISLKIGGEGFGIMEKAEILPNMTAIWLRNQTTEFLLGTDRRKFALSVLVEAEIPRGGRGSENFSQKPKFSGHFLLTSSLSI